MALAVLCCPDGKCGVIVQTKHDAAGMACPRCGKGLQPLHRPGNPGAAGESASGAGPPIVFRCAAADCGVIVRVSGSSGESLSCPRCRSMLPALAVPATAANETVLLPASAPAGLDTTCAPLGQTAPYVPAGPAEPLPARIGRFEVRRLLGQGGFGRVYEAHDPALKRQVALKVLRPEQVQTEGQVQRFLEEARAAARLMHPHIVAVFDSGQDGPHHYIASAHVSGQPLHRAVRARPEGFAWREAAEIVRKLAEALAYAHREGVIHRDVKPGNVMLRDDGEPMLMDFGLAARLEEGAERLTQGRVAMGTPAYMAPEQWAGQAVAASDQYSLGVTLFELLTGKVPFSAGSAAQMMRLHETQPPPLRVNRPDVPRDLEAICLKCLEKEPVRRYGDCQALADDLRRWAAGEVVQARLPGPIERLKKWARRNRAVAALAATVAVVLLLGAGVATVFGIQARWEAGEKGKALLAANEARERELRELYAADMLQASRAFIEGEPLSRALDLLEAWRPERRQGKEYRGREWHLLRRLCDTAEKILVGHEGPLLALAWSADGSLLASGGADRIVRIWDAQTGQCLHALVGHSGGIFDLAFSPDNKLLASAGADSTVRLWEARTGKERHVLRGHILPVYAVAFHPGGQRLASAGGDTVIKVWDCAGGAEIFSLQGHEAPVGRLQFDAPGKRLASCGIIRGTYFWDLQTRAVVDGLDVNGDIVFTPNLATGILASPEGRIGIVNVKDKVVDRGRLGTRRTHALDMDRTARIAAVSGRNDAIGVIDLRTQRTLVTHRGHVGTARRVLLRLDGRKLASAGDDGTVRIWTVPEPDEPEPYSGHHEHNVTAVAYSGDGALLASGDYLGSIAVWDARTGRRSRILGSHYLRRKSQPVPLEIGTGKPLQKGRTLLKAYTHYTASATVRDPIVDCYTSRGHSGEVKGIAFAPDGKRLVSAGGQDLILWDLEGDRPPKEVHHPSLVSSLAISPDGSLAATGCWDRIVRIVRLPSGEIVKQLEGHGDNVTCVAFRPDGKEIATGTEDRTVFVWDIETAKIKHRLRRHAGSVSAVRYTIDGKRLVAGGMDHAIHVWDADTGEHEGALHGHNGGVTSLAVSADGKWLVSASDGSEDPNARVWLWNDTRFREGALIGSLDGKGATAVAVHPVSGNLLLGRRRLLVLEAGPFTETRPNSAEPIAPETQRAKAAPDERLKVLGHASVEEIVVWPGSRKDRVKPGRAGGRFLVVAASLPFSRLMPSGADYRRLLDAKSKDEEMDEPLEFSSLLIDPRRFVLYGGDGQPLPGQFVGRVATAQRDGFEFMKKGVSLVENLTATPRPEDRELVYLAWEVAEGFSARGLRLRFADDEAVPVPSLVLQTFRPGKPFHTASRGFRAQEGGLRLRANVVRFPGP